MGARDTDTVRETKGKNGKVETKQERQIYTPPRLCVHSPPFSSVYHLVQCPPEQKQTMVHSFWFALTGKPGILQFTGSQRARHNLVTEQQQQPQVAGLEE